MFGGVTRAIEIGIPLSGNRTREFVAGLLDAAPLPVSRASAAISVSAGQARLSDVNIQAAGADVQQRHRLSRIRLVVDFEAVLQTESIDVHDHRRLACLRQYVGVIQDFVFFYRH